MADEYRHGWKAERGYYDTFPAFRWLSDEECDWWEVQKRDHLEKLETSMPRTDRAWRRLFGLLNIFERRELDKEEVKERVDMRQLLHNYGVGAAMPGMATQRIFKCPFHDDRSPSFSVDFKRKLWNCHAGDGGGDCFSFVMRMENCTFAEALHILDQAF